MSSLRKDLEILIGHEVADEHLRAFIANYLRRHYRLGPDSDKIESVVYDAVLAIGEGVHQLRSAEAFVRSVARNQALKHRERASSHKRKPFPAADAIAFAADDLAYLTSLEDIVQAWSLSPGSWALLKAVMAERDCESIAQISLVTNAASARKSLRALLTSIFSLCGVRHNIQWSTRQDRQCLDLLRTQMDALSAIDKDPLRCRRQAPRKDIKLEALVDIDGKESSAVLVSVSEAGARLVLTKLTGKIASLKGKVVNIALASKPAVRAAGVVIDQRHHSPCSIHVRFAQPLPAGALGL